MQSTLTYPQNMHNLASPHQASPLSEDVVVSGGEVNQMTQIVTIKPFDVCCEITPKRWKLDFCLLAGAHFHSSRLLPHVPPSLNSRFLYLPALEGIVSAEPIPPPRQMITYQ